MTTTDTHRRAVERALVCPECFAVLDAASAVSFTVETCSFVRCGACFDAAPAQFVERARDVVDGRVVERMRGAA